MIATLRQRNFGLLWWGGLISMAGNWMLYIALPLFVFQMTQSTLATSLMFMIETLPRIALGSVAGVFVDRWERKRTMVITNVLMAIGLLPLLLVGSVEWLPVIYLVGFGQACISQFFGPAENAMLPQLVDEEHLVTANALNTLNNNLARLFGPALGGFAAAWVGLSGVVLLDALTYLICAGLLALISVTSQPARAAADAAAVDQSAWTKLWTEWRAGLRLIWQDRVVRTLFGVIALTAVGEGIFGVLFVVFTNVTLHGGAQELGWLMSAQAVGGLLGGLTVGWVARRLAPVPLLAITAVLFGLGDLLIFNVPLFLPSVPLVAVLFVVVGIISAGFGPSLNTLLQTRVVDEFRGRVFGAFDTTFSLLALIGMALAGFLGDIVGPVPVLNIQGIGYVVCGVLMVALVLPAVRSQAADRAPAAEVVPTAG
ncbi:MAG TPA: MFS transporter [Chloroflexia bacterium]|nr:MFS transporter [Chloroflexia bacterium]